MKQFIIENKNTVISVVLWMLVFVSVGYIIYKQHKIINETKQELIKEQSNQSSADIISTTILNKKSNIVVTDKEIKELEVKKQKLELEVNCWKNQMNRLVDWLEYNLEYCTDENNLNKFKEDFQ